MNIEIYLTKMIKKYKNSIATNNLTYMYFIFYFRRFYLQTIVT